MELSEDEKQKRLAALKALLEGAEQKEGELSYAQHLSAMFSADDAISEEGKEKIKTLFEAAVGYEVEKQVTEAKAALEQERETMKAEFDTKLAEGIEQNKAEVQVEVDAYLAKIVEDWTEQNKVQLQHKVKLDIFESFVSGMRELFVEHDINIPAEKADMVEGLVARIDTLEADVKTLSTKNVELGESLEAKEREVAFIEVSEGLTALDVEKLRGLVEGQEFDTLEAYTNGIKLLKESYFKQTVEVPEEETTVNEEKPEEIPESIKLYAESISKRYGKKK